MTRYCCDFPALPQGSAASVLVGDVLQLVLRGAHDSIPNVRFTAVRALQEMAPHLDAGAVDSQVRGWSIAERHLYQLELPRTRLFGAINPRTVDTMYNGGI